MSDPQLFETRLKERKFSFLALVKRLNELHAVVCLNAFDLERKDLSELIYESNGRIGGLFLKSGNIAETRIFVHSGILIKSIH